MKNNDSQCCEQNTTPKCSGLVIVVVLYILLSIILASHRSC